MTDLLHYFKNVWTCRYAEQFSLHQQPVLAYMLVPHPPWSVVPDFTRVLLLRTGQFLFCCTFKIIFNQICYCTSSLRSLNFHECFVLHRKVWIVWDFLQILFPPPPVCHPVRILLESCFMNSFVKVISDSTSSICCKSPTIRRVCVDVNPFD